MEIFSGAFGFFEDCFARKSLCLSGPKVVDRDGSQVERSRLQGYQQNVEHALPQLALELIIEW